MHTVSQTVMLTSNQDFSENSLYTVPVQTSILGRNDNFPSATAPSLPLDEAIFTQTSPSLSSVSGRSDDSGYATDTRYYECKVDLSKSNPSKSHRNPRRGRQCHSGPPSLPNQRDTSLSFVKLLICMSKDNPRSKVSTKAVTGFSTGLVASIWPLSERGGIPLLTFI